MNAIVMSPMQWANVKDIDETEPVNENDHECLYELREVLKKHGMQNRFGVALLHSHLDISDDEAFLESCDEESRCLHLKPVPFDEAAGDGNVGTIFHLGNGDFMTSSWCRSYCERTLLGGHNAAHRVEK